MSIRPAARKTPSRPELADPRTESGERRIALPSDLAATRMSERFELPEEALPSIPPPPPLGSDEGTRSVGIATARLAVPDTLKLLSVAIPTPQAFTPESVVIPKAAPAPAIDGAPEREAPASDEALEAPAASQAPRVMTNHARRRQIVSALVLFVALVSASALALRLCADFLFR